MREVDEGLILSLVRRELAVQPRLGTRKLLYVPSDEMQSVGVSMGRDRLCYENSHLALTMCRGISNSENILIYTNKKY